MINTKIDASVYYRTHFKNIYDSPFKTRNDNFLKYTPREETRLTTAFNLLFSYLPSALVPYMQFAANVDPEFYSNMETLSDVNFFSKVKFEKLDENRLGLVSRLSSSDSNKLKQDLLVASESAETLADRLINRRDTNLLCVIENQMQINLFPNVIGPGDDVSKKKTFANMLAKVGCTKQLVHKITGAGSKIIKDLFDATETEYSRPIRRYRVSDESNVFGISQLIKVCSSKNISNQIMLMLSLYTICSRILLNKLPTSNHFDQEDISEKLSVPLAVGVYKCCYDLFKNFSRLYPDKSRSQFEFTFFDDYFSALEIYTSKQAEVVACEDCHTPYLNLYVKNGSGKVVLNKDNGDIYPGKKQTICPNCKCEFDYSLYD